MHCPEPPVRVIKIAVKLKSVIKIPLVGRLADSMVCRQEAVKKVEGFVVRHVNNLCPVVCKFTKTTR
jgi:hypothetical protein